MVSMGYMQIMPDTFVGLGYNLSTITDSYSNIMAGTQYMTQLYEHYKNWEDVYAAYNWGIGNYDDYLDAINNGRVPEDDMPEETRNHVNRVRDRKGNYLMPITDYTIQQGTEDVDLAVLLRP